MQLHECRHSFSSWLSAAGVPDRRADRYMGHADHSTPGRYRHQLDAQYLDDAMALGDYLRRADTPTRVGQLRASEGQSPTVPSLPQRDSDPRLAAMDAEPEPLQ